MNMKKKRRLTSASFLPLILLMFSMVLMQFPEAGTQVEDSLSR